MNLPQDADEHHGADLPLVVEASNVSAESINYAEWWIEPNGDNTPERYLSRQQRAHLRRTITRNRDDHFRNTLSLPHVGGDRYDIKSSKRNDRGNAVTIDTVETWRKLFFSIFNMNDRCESHMNGVKGPMISGMNDVFVEMVEGVTTRTQVQEDETEIRNGLRHYFQYPGHASDPMYLPDRPFHLRVLVIERLFLPREQAYDETTTHVVHYQNTIRDLTDNNWLVRARARLRPGGHWRDVTAQTEKMGQRQFSVDLADQTEFWDGVHDDNKQIQLQVTTREKIMAAGMSNGNLVVLAIIDRDGNEQQPRFSTATLIHELGHACNQVVRRERLYNGHGSPSGWEDNNRWYTNAHGGVGSHCSHNAHLVAAPQGQTTSGQHYVPNAGQTTCVMHHRLNPQIGREYCDLCQPHVKRADLGRASLVRRNWDG